MPSFLPRRDAYRMLATRTDVHGTHNNPLTRIPSFAPRRLTNMAHQWRFAAPAPAFAGDYIPEWSAQPFSRIRLLTAALRLLTSFLRLH
jgi:hypothetical protein